jgi:hypothetical protein
VHHEGRITAWVTLGNAVSSRPSDALIGPGRAAPAAGLAALLTRAIAVLALSGGLLWLVWLYAAGLRDPRYLDGWVLAGGMALQIGYHIAIKTASLSPRSAARWRKVHVFAGYLLIAAFISHCDFTLPDTGFEWALWAGFVLVTLSGLFGTYLAWSLRVKRRVDDGVSYERIPALRAELARDVAAAVGETDPAAPRLALPGLPHDGWIMDLYTTHLRDYFERERNFAAHLMGSQRPLKRLTDDIDGLARYVDQHGQDKLAVIKALVIDKDQLDFARVHLWLGKAWLFVHVPVTYALIALTVLHILVVYAFSSGSG